MLCRPACTFKLANFFLRINIVTLIAKLCVWICGVNVCVGGNVLILKFRQKLYLLMQLHSLNYISLSTREGEAQK